MKHPKIVAVENLVEEPYASIVCYPRTNPTEIYHRLEEMQQHGATSIEFVGKTKCVPIFLYLAKVT